MHSPRSSTSHRERAGAGVQTFCGSTYGSSCVRSIQHRRQLSPRWGDVLKRRAGSASESSRCASDCTFTREYRRTAARLRTPLGTRRTVTAISTGLVSPFSGEARLVFYPQHFKRSFKMLSQERVSGAGRGNRNPDSSLENSHFTTKLYPPPLKLRRGRPAFNL